MPQYTISIRNPEIPIMECNATELDAIRITLAYSGMMEKAEDKIAERLKAIPNGMKRWHTALTNMKQLNDTLMDSVPDKQYSRIRRESNTCAWHFQPLSVSGKDCTTVDSEDLKMLAGKIMEEECSMCLKDRSEWRGCKLRKIFMTYLPPENVDRKGNECPYQTVVRNSDYGNYIGHGIKVIGNGDEGEDE